MRRTLGGTPDDGQNVHVPKRTHPVLASDVVRTLVFAAVSMPISIFLDEAALVLFPRLDPELIGDAASYVGWALFAFMWAGAALILFGRADSATMHRWLAETTPKTRGRRFVWRIFGGGGTYWAIIGSFTATASLIQVAVTDDTAVRPILVASAVLVVIASLTLTVVAYAVRYAREAATGGGFVFAGTPEPRLSDYIYLAAHLTISLGGADVVVESPKLRRLITTHSIFAYAYNTLVLGLLVSLLLDAIA